MKKFISTLCIIILLTTLCSCKSNSNNNNNNTTSTATSYSSLQNDTENEETIAQKIPSTESKLESVESMNSKDESINQESSTFEPTVSDKPQSTPEQTKPTQPKLETTNDTIFGFTVNDPNNTRGLSEQKFGFSYGVAKNGKPHNQSIANQQTFDNMANVSALALDTKTTEKVMYLTFDNGYEYQNLTEDILDTLKEKNVKAAFFITLDYAKKNKDIVKRMIDDGHIVGNHSTTHPVFPDITRTKMAKEIGELNEYLKINFSYTSPYFRFPTGAYSENSLELVTSIGFNSVFWSIAHSDWDTSAQKGADNAYNTVTSRFHPGAVILLHAVSSDNAQALDRIIDKALKDGYTFKTLDDYFK